MTHRARHLGMTLLEVVLAIALATGVIGGALGFYSHALDIRARLETEMRRIESQRSVMDMLTNELRRAMSIRFLNMGLEGDVQEMEFPCATLGDYRRIWEPLGSTEDPVSPEYDVPVVGYRLRIVEDEETGEEVVVGLERTFQKLPTVQAAEEEEEIESKLLSELIRFVGFRYWRGGIWLGSWSGGDLPQAVEITVGSEPLPEGTEIEDYPYPVFRRVVYLPGGFAGQRGAIIRGGPGR